MLVNSGAEARRERGEDRARGHRPARGHRVRPGVPRAHAARAVAHRQGRTRTRSRSARTRPRSTARRSRTRTAARAGSRRRSRGSRRASTPSQIACVVVEPIAGEGGFVVPEPGWFAGIARVVPGERRRCSSPTRCRPASGAPGAWFASEHEGVVPDLVATAKGLGGGMPIAGVTGRAEIMDAVHVGGLGSTFGGNPVSCAAALAAIDVIETRRPRRTGAEARRPHARSGSPQCSSETTGRRRRARPRRDGRDRARPRRRLPRRRPRQADLRSRVTTEGVIVLTAGTLGNVVRLLPPLVLDETLLDAGPRRARRRGPRLMPRTGATRSSS